MTPTERAHAEAIEDARQALDSATEAAIKDGLSMRVVAADMVVDGVVHEDARVVPMLFRRIECATD